MKSACVVAVVTLLASHLALSLPLANKQDAAVTSHPHETSPSTRPSELFMSTPSTLFRILDSTASHSLRPSAATSKSIETSTSSRPSTPPTSTPSRRLPEEDLSSFIIGHHPFHSDYVQSSAGHPSHSSQAESFVSHGTPPSAKRRRIRRQQDDGIETDDDGDKDEGDYWTITRNTLTSMGIILNVVKLIFSHLT